MANLIQNELVIVTKESQQITNTVLVTVKHNFIKHSDNYTCYML
jgi:hypothetical protein